MTRTIESLPSRLYLLSYDPLRERLTGGMWLGYGLRAAALAELHLEGYLTDVNRHAIPAPGRTPPADPVLRAVAADAGTGRRRWENLIKRDRPGTEAAVRAHLDTAGTIRVVREPRLLRRARIEVRDVVGAARLRDHVGSVLRNPLPVDRVPAADRVLVAIAAMVGLRSAIDREQARDYRDRIKAMTDGSGPAVDALHRAIRQARSSMS